tara:strand:+ start:1948 stop:2424 length:477 start_codon:yes stop_codon:yes gene_type:complete
MVATINTPAFAVTKSADQSISDVTLTTVTFDTEDFDTDAAFASNKFTVPSSKPGVYFFQCELYCDSSSDIGSIECEFYKTPSGGSAASVAATEVYVHSTGSPRGYMARVSHSEKLAAGDSMEVKINSDLASSGTLNVNQSNAATDNRTRFSGFRIAGV